MKINFTIEPAAQELCSGMRVLNCDGGLRGVFVLMLDMWGSVGLQLIPLNWEIYLDHV
jgi:hypothetical protein